MTWFMAHLSSCTFSAPPTTASLHFPDGCLMIRSPARNEKWHLMIITSDMIFSLSCDYIPGANRKHRRHSAHPPNFLHHRHKVNPEHVHSLQPIHPVFLLPSSSFTSNSPSISPNCFWRPRLGQFLQARHFIIAKNWTHGDLRSVPGSHTRSRLPFSAWERDFYRQLSESCGCTLTTLIMISIGANQGFPLRSCMLIWAPS